MEKLVGHWGLRIPGQPRLGSPIPGHQEATPKDLHDFGASLSMNGTAWDEGSRGRFGSQRLQTMHGGCS